MTQEEKAKVYTELINRLEDVKNAIKKQNYGIAMDILCKPYPEYQITTSTELKESENIRKRIIDALHGDVLEISEIKEAIDWLKTQGKHSNFLSKIQVGDKVTRNEDGVLVNLSQLNRVAKKQGEQKPAEEYNITGIGSKNAQGKLGEMIKNLKSVNEVLEHESAWSEKHIADVFEKVGLAKIAREQSNDNLTNALQDAMIELSKFTPQPKQEWSEEDEKFVHGLIRGLAAKRDIHGHTTFSSDCIDITGTINWLKSLKDRVQPQPKQEYDDMAYEMSMAVLYDKLKDSLHPKWKPSEEQMDALHYVTNFDYGGHKATLVSLYEQLKKLKA